MLKMTVPTVTLTVTRDAMTILPCTIPAHEADIVRAVFGEDNVQTVEGAKSDSVEIEVTNDEGQSVEAERLEAKYGPTALANAFGANFRGQIAKAVAAVEVKPAKKPA